MHDLNAIFECCPEAGFGKGNRRGIIAILIIFSLLLLCGLLSCSKKSKNVNNSDSGDSDTIYLESYRIDRLNWGVNLSLLNHEEIFAMTIPLTFSAAYQNRLVADSVTYNGGRVESFQIKIVRPDTLTQCVTIALFADLGNTVPPLPSGTGLIARLFISSLDRRDISGFTIDTTTTPPSNSLLLVTPESEGIVPSLVITAL